jgi:hypothetical protein
MNEPAEMIAGEARRKADQALLLARIFASVVTVAVGGSGVLVGSAAGPFHEMFAELGVELPVISRLLIEMPGVWMSAVLVLTGVTLFFIWSKGRAAAWMAGSGLLLLALAVPVMMVVMIQPLVRIINEMGNM